MSANCYLERRCRKRQLDFSLYVGYFAVGPKTLFVNNGFLTVYIVYILQRILAITDDLSVYKNNLDVHKHFTRKSHALVLIRTRLEKAAKCSPVTGIKLFNTVLLK